jgi:hypothetical protein
MSWRIDDHPDEGLMITPLSAPRFTARWATGTFPLDEVREGGFFWTDEGSSEEDAIHIYDVIWIDECMPQGDVDRVMARGVRVIDGHIASGC